MIKTKYVIVKNEDEPAFIDKWDNEFGKGESPKKHRWNIKTKFYRIIILDKVKDKIYKDLI